MKHKQKIKNLREAGITENYVNSILASVQEDLEAEKEKVRQTILNYLNKNEVYSGQALIQKIKKL